MSFYYDSRSDSVTLDYNELDITCQTDFLADVDIAGDLAFTGTFNNSVLRNGTLSTLAALNNIYTIATVPGKSYLVEFTTCGYQNTANTSFVQKSLTKITNVAGVVTIVFGFGNQFSLGIAGGGQSITGAGANCLVNILQTANGNLTNWQWELKISTSS